MADNTTTTQQPGVTRATTTSGQPAQPAQEPDAPKAQSEIGPTTTRGAKIAHLIMA